MAYRQITQQFHVARLAIDVAAAAAASWRERQRRAQLELSLNDLIESGAKTQVGRRAHEIIENIERVSTALFQHIQRVNGAVRLAWVQRMLGIRHAHRPARPVAAARLALAAGGPAPADRAARRLAVRADRQ